MTPTTWIFALLGSTVVGLVAWLCQRSVAAIDKKVDDTHTISVKTAEVVQEMRSEMSGYTTLVRYLSDDVKELKAENRSLRDSHHAFDKYIAVQQALHKLSPNN